jgi:integrase
MVPFAAAALDEACPVRAVHRNADRVCRRASPAGRPSLLNLAQAKAVLAAAEGGALHAYVVISLLIGARTEELRALTWDRVDLEGQPKADPPVPPSIQVWRSVRESGDTKTKKSRRALALPIRAVNALRDQQHRQDEAKERVGAAWQNTRLAFTSQLGTELDAANVRRACRRVIKAAGLDPRDWTPRELRHSFVSLLSDGGVSIEDIAELCGHSGTRVTESVYRHQLRPVLLNGAVAMEMTRLWWIVTQLDTQR